MFFARMHKTLLTLVAFGALLFNGIARGDSLVELERIVGPFETLRSFLLDPKAVLQYREALKRYMNQDASFDPVYAEFIRQIRLLDENVPGFGANAWRVNPNWQQEIFTIEAEKAACGLEIRRTAVFKSINRTKSQLKQAGKSINPENFQRLSQIQIQRYGLPSAEEFNLLSSRQQRLLFGRLDEAGFSKNRTVKAITQYLAHAVLTHDEALKDALFSGDADLLLEALKKLKRPGGFQATLAALGLSNDLLPFLELANAELGKLIESHAQGLRHIEDFRTIAEAPAPEQLLAELAALVGQGVEQADLANHLTKEGRKQWFQWRKDTNEVLSAKKKALSRYRKANPYFTFETFYDRSRNSIRLTVDAKGKTIHYVPAPRPFHVFFSGRKVKECISGRDKEGIAAKRFARAALKGSRDWFTELADRKMEGLIGTTRLHAKNPAKRKGVLYALDFSSRASKSKVLITGASGRANYSIFEILVDKLVERGLANLVLGNGFQITQNIVGEGIITQSAAYREGTVLGAPEDFTPVDKMAAVISQKFPEVLMDYGDGGMVYSGAWGDGHELIRLTPRVERGGRTRPDLEKEVYSLIIQRLNIPDSDPVWKAARENNIVLDSAQTYRRRAKNAGQEWLAAATELAQDETTAGHAFRALAAAVRSQPARPDLRSDLILTRATEALQSKSWSRTAAFEYLTAVYEMNPDCPGLKQKEVLLILEPMLKEFNEFHRLVSSETGLVSTLFNYQSNDPELFAWLIKIYAMEFGSAYKDALNNAFIQAFKAKRPGGEPVYLLARLVQREEVDFAHQGRFGWVFSVALAGEHADKKHSVEILSSILLEKPGTHAARLAGKLVYNNAGDFFSDVSLVTPELVAGLTRNIASLAPASDDTGYNYLGSSALAELIRKHPALTTVVTMDLLSVLYEGMAHEKEDTRRSCNYVMGEIFEHHTALLKQSHRAAYDRYLNAPENRETLHWKIFQSAKILGVVLADKPPGFVVKEVKRRAADRDCHQWVREAAKGL